MNFTSVSGKKWIFKHFNLSEIKEYSETYKVLDFLSSFEEIQFTVIRQKLFLKTLRAFCIQPIKFLKHHEQEHQMHI